MKCYYCENKATHRRTPDIDIKGIPLCDDRKCFVEMYMEVNWKDTKQFFWKSIAELILQEQKSYKRYCGDCLDIIWHKTTVNHEVWTCDRCWKVRTEIYTVWNNNIITNK